MAYVVPYYLRSYEKWHMWCPITRGAMKMAYVVPYYMRSYENGICGALLPEEL